MSKRDKSTHNEPIVTPEMVARMPMEAIREGLLQLGLDPDEPLPEKIRYLISQDLEQLDSKLEEEPSLTGNTP